MKIEANRSILINGVCTWYRCNYRLRFFLPFFSSRSEYGIFRGNVVMPKEVERILWVRRVLLGLILKDYWFGLWPNEITNELNNLYRIESTPYGTYYVTSNISILEGGLSGVGRVSPNVPITLILDVFVGLFLLLELEIATHTMFHTIRW